MEGTKQNILETNALNIYRL